MPRIFDAIPAPAAEVVGLTLTGEQPFAYNRTRRPLIDLGVPRAYTHKQWTNIHVGISVVMPNYLRVLPVVPEAVTLSEY